MDTSDDLLIFAIEASHEYGERVSRSLGIALSAHEERSFEDGEHKIRSLVNVRNRDVFVIQSLYGDAQQSVNDKLVRLLIFIGALKDASAARVTAVIPYLAYARKDRRTQSRDPVTTRYLAQLLESVGTDRVVSLDVHNLAAFENAYRCRIDHLEARELFVRYFAPWLRNDELTVVSPDVGGFKRADAFREALSRRLGRPLGLAFMEKRRQRGLVSGETLVGDVAGRTVIIIDDLISTGGTILRALKACYAEGAAHVCAAASHGLFVGNAAALVAEPGLGKLVITDSVTPFRLPLELVSRKVEILDSARLFAEAIARIHSGESVSELLQS